MEFLSAIMCPLPLFLIIIFYASKLALQKLDQCCYMLDYVCYKGKEDSKLDTKTCAKILLRSKKILALDDYRFLLKTMVTSGIGEETYGPKTIMDGKQESPRLEDAMSELDDLIFSTMDKLFARTGVSPSEIDILVTTVSLISSAPSLTARIINHYKMRENVKAFNLSGMGCSSSVAGIDLVQQLFKSYKNQFAIIVSTELMGTNWYNGKRKSMMLSNILFRAGGCSMLLTNKRAFKDRAILKLNCMVRTHHGASDEAYNSCMEVEDDEGYKGFHLSRSLPKVGAEALTINLRTLLPKVLPPWEILRYAIVSYYQHKFLRKPNSDASLALGIDLKSGIDHFCIHPGGRAIVDGVGKCLGLDAYDLEPTRMALHRFGNTSSGGLWYVLGYMEAKKRLKKGDKILMISLGAGFKCNNCVWKVMSNLKDANVWDGIIDQYPPDTLVNPFTDKFNWIFDPSIDFVRLEEAIPALKMDDD